MNNDITALRAALFETLHQVKSGEIDLDKARAVNEIGKTLIDTARVEVDYLRAVGRGESQFLAVEHQAGDSEPGNGITGITRHILRG